ncbi:hypothetical protein HO175_08380 [Pantoea allii]|nr:hypothetical protein [Pantoea allii]
MFLRRFLKLIINILIMVSTFNVNSSDQGLTTLTLSDNDFSVLINNYAYAPGETWSNESFIRAGRALGSIVASDKDIDTKIYNYYQHNYDGYELYSASPVVNGKYAILVRISLKNNEISTARNITVGDDIEQVLAVYGPGKEDGDNNQKWLRYTVREKSIKFQIEKNKVSRIVLETNFFAKKKEINPEQAIDTAKDAIQLYHLTTLKEQCLRYDINDELEDGFYMITVREDNHDIICGGDPDISPRLFDIKISRDNSKILTNADSGDGTYITLNKSTASN